MSIKKKLSLGVASAALGLALVGGGTWAAFNDVEKLDNRLATGTLDLEIEQVKIKNKKQSIPKTFELSNIKPGDKIVRAFKLKNNGSLAIREVLMNLEVTEFKNGVNEFVNKHKMPDNDKDDFLKQFKVELLLTGAEGSNDKKVIISSNQNVTLYDLVNNKYNLAPAPDNSQNKKYTGIPLNPKDEEIVVLAISMIKDDTKVTDPNSKAYGEYVQNKYQGDSIKFKLIFEATQWEGLKYEDTLENGELTKNKESHSNENAPGDLPDWQYE
jgi:spore coat-associated protein N